MRGVALIVLAVAVVGCGQKEVTSADVKPKDAYAGMSPQQKIDAIRSDPKISDMQKHQMISDAQRAAGMPATG